MSSAVDRPIGLPASVNWQTSSETGSMQTAAGEHPELLNDLTSAAVAAAESGDTSAGPTARLQQDLTYRLMQSEVFQ